MSEEWHSISENNGRSMYLYDTAHVSELLKRKRRARGIKSCFPCRHRKVRCDGNSPCSTCVQRNHAELCRTLVSNNPIEKKNNPTGGVTGNPGLDAQRFAQDACSTTSEHSQGRIAVELGHLDFSNDDASRPEQLYPPSPMGLASSQNRAGIDINRMINRLEDIEKQITALKTDLFQQAHRGSIATLPASNPNLNSASFRGSFGLSSDDTRQIAVTTKSPGNTFVEDATGATIFLGEHSDPPLALGCRQSSHDMLNNECFDHLVPKTYPFANIWRSEVTSSEIYQTLPDDSDIIRYWQSYQDFAYPFYPVLVTLDQFSVSLFAFLDRRSSIRDRDTSFRDVDWSWLALLFAVLACGVQFSTDGAKERDLRSKVFICSSFQCLRMLNFFNNTNIDQIQALALIGHCQRNNSDANSAWILMGSTIRLAQSIGLHEEPTSTKSLSHLSSSEKFQERRLWWMLTWQDVFLSFTYDRPHGPMNSHCSIPYNPSPDSRSTSNGLSFAESIFKLLQIVQHHAQHQVFTATHPLQELCATTLSYKANIERIFKEAAPFLTNKSMCRTLQDHLERLALNIHVGYAVCRMCRLFLDESTKNSSNVDSDGSSNESSSIRDSLVAECIWRASEVVESFLDMHRFSPQVCRSWAFVHNAVSCAMTLKHLEEPKMREENQLSELIKKLIFLLEKEEVQSKWFDEDANQRHFGPYSRALKALKATYEVSCGDEEVRFDPQFQ